MILLVCSLLAAVTLGAGGALTAIGPWYLGLSVPAWKPPNWAFGPVWTAIGIGAIASSDLAWQAARGREEHRTMLALFALNAVLNVIWSLLFFKLKRPDWALIEVLPLWLSVLALVLVLWPIRPLSGALLLPYLLWVAIAACLNASVVRRNAPFGATAPRRSGGQ